MKRAFAVGDRARRSPLSSRNSAVANRSQGLAGIHSEMPPINFLAQQSRREAQRRTEESLRAVLDVAPLAVATVDRRGRVANWNAAAESIFGYTAQEISGRTIPVKIQNRLMRRALFESICGGESVLARECQCFRKDGAQFFGSISAAPLHDGSGEFSGAIVLVEDITARYQAQQAINRMSAALATAREDEARRIARELHDDITQRLAILSIDMGLAAAELSLGPQARQRLQSYQAQLVDVSEAIRELSHRMHPSILDDVGLRAALELLCSDFQRRTGVVVTFRADSLPDAIHPEIASCLYRIAQECFHNISKYAHAKDVSVRLAGAGDEIDLCILDSGVGFDTAVQQPGLGLHSVRERARLVNGDISIVSEPGAGTRVVVSVPLGGSEAAVSRTDARLKSPRASQ